MEGNQESVERKSVGDEIREDLSGAYKKVREIAGDALGYVMIRLDDGLCMELDAFVDAGVVENRRQAVLYFLAEGLKSSQNLFERISETESQVEQLRKEMRSLKALESAE